MKNIEEIEIQKQYIEKVRKENEGKKLTYNILTMGCQLNENDSEKLCGMIEQMGYIRIDEAKKADLAVMNTCCVRENAEDKLFGKLGELKKIKRTKRNHNRNWWMYDARKTHTRKIEKKLSIF